MITYTPSPIWRSPKSKEDADVVNSTIENTVTDELYDRDQYLYENKADNTGTISSSFVINSDGAGDITKALLTTTNTELIISDGGGTLKKLSGADATNTDQFVTKAQLDSLAASTSTVVVFGSGTGDDIKLVSDGSNDQFKVTNISDVLVEVLGADAIASTAFVTKQQFDAISTTTSTTFRLDYGGGTETKLISTSNRLEIRNNADVIKRISGAPAVLIDEFVTLSQLNSSTIGIDQEWQNVAGSRLVATSYQNSTTHPIMVSISTTGTGTSSLEVSTDDAVWTVISSCSDAESDPYNHTAIIPKDHYYKLTSTGHSISYWVELR